MEYLISWLINFNCAHIFKSYLDIDGNKYQRWCCAKKQFFCPAQNGTQKLLYFKILHEFLVKEYHTPGRFIPNVNFSLKPQESSAGLSNKNLFDFKLKLL